MKKFASMERTNYRLMVEDIIGLKYCLSAKYIEDTLVEEVKKNLDAEIESFDFEAINFKYHLEREIIWLDNRNEYYEEKWNWKKIS